MIKKGDKVVCIIQSNEWYKSHDCEEANFPQYKEECIVEEIKINFNEPFLTLIGYNYQYAAHCFRKVEDNFADNILNNIKDQIIEEEFDKQLIEAGEYISKWKGN